MFVMVGPDTEVSVTGTAEQDYLKPGVTVEFVADIDKAHGQGQDRDCSLSRPPPTARRALPAGFASRKRRVKRTTREGQAVGPRSRLGDAPAKGRKPRQEGTDP